MDKETSGNALDLTSEDKIKSIMVVFAAEGLKAGALLLEELPREEIKRLLQTVGAWDNVSRLSQIVEGTLDFDGGAEFSRVLSVLEPAQIKDVAHVSLMLIEDIVEVNPLDYADGSKWIEISRAHKDAILQSGDKKLINRLHNLHPTPYTQEEREKGPWALYVHDREICCNHVASFLSAIINAEQDDAWKKTVVREIGLELFAYAATQAPHILTILVNFDQELYAVVDKLARSEKIHERALAGNAEVVDEFSLPAAASSVVEIPGGDNLEQMISDLRHSGGDVTGAIAESSKADTAIEELLAEGIPEEE